MVAQNTTNKAVAQNTSRKLIHGELVLVEFARAVRRSMSEGQDLPAPIRIRPPSHLLKLSTLTSFNHTDRQLVAFSISKNVARQLHNSSKRGDPDVSRNLATLSIPTDVATQLLTLSAYNDWTQQASGFPCFRDVNWVHPVPLLQRAIVESDGFDSNTRGAREQDIVRQLLELSRWSDAVKSLPFTSVFSEAELAVAVKLLNLFACNDYTQGFAAAVFTEYDFHVAHSLLNRFAFQNSRGLAVFNFTRKMLPPRISFAPSASPKILNDRSAQSSSLSGIPRNRLSWCRFPAQKIPRVTSLSFAFGEKRN